MLAMKQLRVPVHRTKVLPPATPLPWSAENAERNERARSALVRRLHRKELEESEARSYVAALAESQLEWEDPELSLPDDHPPPSYSEKIIIDKEAGSSGSSGGGGGGQPTTIKVLPVDQYPALEFPSDFSILETNNAEDADRWAKQAIDEMDEDVVGLGFDSEFTPIVLRGLQRGPLDIIQLSTSKSGLVLHTNKMKTLPERISDLLKNPDVMKFGIAVAGDFALIESTFGVKSSGGFDLRRGFPTIRDFGALQYVVATVLRRYLAKPIQYRMGNWSNYPLPDAQLMYAALDAYAGIAVARSLVEQGAKHISLSVKSRLNL